MDDSLISTKFDSTEQQVPVFELTPPTERDLLIARVSEIMAECIRANDRGPFFVWCEYRANLDVLEVTVREDYQDVNRWMVCIDSESAAGALDEVLERVAAVGVGS